MHRYVRASRLERGGQAFGRRRWTALLATTCLTLSAGLGCTHYITPGVRESVPTVERAFDWTVALYVPPESAGYEYEYGLVLVRVGPTFKAAALQMLQGLFANAYEIAAPRPEPGQPEPDFVIVQTIESWRAWKHPERDTEYRFEVTARWEVQDPGGERVFAVTHRAEGFMQALVFEWQSECLGAVHAALRTLLSEFAADLTGREAGKPSPLVAERARRVGFFGWMSASDLAGVAAVLSEHVWKAAAQPGFQLLSEDAVQAELAQQDVSLGEIIADSSSIVAIARSLKCGAVLVGQIEAVGESLRLSLLQFDGLTGERVARVEEVAQPDDVRGLMNAVDRMMSSLKLGAPPP